MTKTFIREDIPFIRDWVSKNLKGLQKITIPQLYWEIKDNLLSFPSTKQCPSLKSFVINFTKAAKAGYFDGVLVRVPGQYYVRPGTTNFKKTKIPFVKTKPKAKAKPENSISARARLNLARVNLLNSL